MTRNTVKCMDPVKNYSFLFWPWNSCTVTVIDNVLRYHCSPTTQHQQSEVDAFHTALNTEPIRSDELKSSSWPISFRRFAVIKIWKRINDKQRRMTFTGRKTDVVRLGRPSKQKRVATVNDVSSQFIVGKLQCCYLLFCLKDKWNYKNFWVFFCLI